MELIELYHSNNPNLGYNKDNGGTIGKMTSESIEKVRQWHLGRELSEETRKRYQKVIRELQPEKTTLCTVSIIQKR